MAAGAGDLNLDEIRRRGDGPWVKSERSDVNLRVAVEPVDRADFLEVPVLDDADCPTRQRFFRGFKDETDTAAGRTFAS